MHTLFRFQDLQSLMKWKFISKISRNVFEKVSRFGLFCFHEFLGSRAVSIRIGTGLLILPVRAVMGLFKANLRMGIRSNSDINLVRIYIDNRDT
jgi:hypothetical protein